LGWCRRGASPRGILSLREKFVRGRFCVPQAERLRVRRWPRIPGAISQGPTSWRRLQMWMFEWRGRRSGEPGIFALPMADVSHARSLDCLSTSEEHAKK